ncbi:hypothetical protein K8Q94_00325 [Candidatus Nomurabacteria bacterium]|nr:hypothetical protein [Candidatus Nomurabacteria bacterium]
MNKKQKFPIFDDSIFYLGLPLIDKKTLRPILKKIKSLKSLIKEKRKAKKLNKKILIKVSKYGIIATNLLFPSVNWDNKKPQPSEIVKSIYKKYNLSKKDNDLLLDFLAEIWIGSVSPSTKKLKKYLSLKENLDNNKFTKYSDKYLKLLVKTEIQLCLNDWFIQRNLGYRDSGRKQKNRKIKTTADAKKDLLDTINNLAKKSNSGQKLFYYIREKVMREINIKIRYNKKVFSGYNDDDLAILDYENNENNNYPTTSHKANETDSLDLIEDVNGEKYFLTQQTADATGISDKTLRRYREKGLIPAYWSSKIKLTRVQPKGRWLFNVKDFNQIRKIKEEQSKNKISKLKNQ